MQHQQLGEAYTRASWKAKPQGWKENMLILIFALFMILLILRISFMLAKGAIMLMIVMGGLLFIVVLFLIGTVSGP